MDFNYRTWCGFLCAIFLAVPPFSSTAATLDDLKKLEIICFVPSYLPKGFQLKSAEITYDEDPSEEGKTRKVPLYSMEWENATGSGFSIESAWEGIGDRNLMETEDSEDAEFQTKLFGKVFFIYTPKGKDRSGVKKEIRSNWVEDANMKAETATDPHGQTDLGRYHGFTGTNMTVADFERIIGSLHPVKNDGAKSEKPKETGGAPELKLHPKIFNLIECWISDVESPVVTEISLDAVDKNGNEFNDDDVKADGEWTRCPTPEDGGFMRYRVLESKGSHQKIEYQENGGGTLTTASIIEFDIQKRNIERDGKPASIRVLRVTSYSQKKV